MLHNLKQMFTIHNANFINIEMISSRMWDTAPSQWWLVFQNHNKHTSIPSEAHWVIMQDVALLWLWCEAVISVTLSNYLLSISMSRSCNGHSVVCPRPVSGSLPRLTAVNVPLKHCMFNIDKESTCHHAVLCWATGSGIPLFFFLFFFLKKNIFHNTIT